MNYQALRDEILNSERASNYAPYVVTNDVPKQNAFDKDTAIAELLNAPLGSRLVSNKVDAVEMMASLGAITAATILTKLEAAVTSHPFLKWAITALNTDRGLDFGTEEMQTMLDNLATADVITTAEASLLKALGVAPSSIAYQLIGQPVTWAEVSIALRGNANFSVG